MSTRPVAMVLRLSALGDVILTEPFIAALAATHDVVFITSPAYVELVRAMPGVVEAISLDRKEGLAGAVSLGRKLKGLSASFVFDLQHKTRTIALCRATGAPVTSLHRRTGWQMVKAAFGRDTVIDDQHQVARYLSLLPDPPAPRDPRLTLQGAWEEEARQLWKARGWRDDFRPLAIAPSATHPTKGWGPERWAELARRTAAEAMVLVAGPADLEQSHAYREAVGPSVDLLDGSALPLTTLAAVLARCSRVAGNDSGALHLARAVGTPTVTVFGPTSPVRWGPVTIGHAHKVVRLPMACSPCTNHGGARCPLGHHHCMTQLSVDEVERVVFADHSEEELCGTLDG